jgi:micrococcal nuclease
MRSKLFFKLFYFSLLTTILCSSNIWASEKSYGDFIGVTFVGNHDGDTITVNIAYVHDILGKNITVMVFGIDTPEIVGRCDKEHLLAVEVKEYVHSILVNSHVDLLNIKRDKYFRILADVRTKDGDSLAKILLDKGYAIEYDGGTKTKNWCE